MTTAYTSLLGLALPVDGELTGTWGQVVNNYITTYLDGAVAGTQIISGGSTQTAVTLSKTTGTALIQVGSGTAGSSQYQVIKCSGAPASLLTVTVPSAEKTYLVINATSTSQSVKIVGASGTGVTIASGKTSIVAWNGTDFVEITPATATTATTATNLAGGGAGQLPYQTASGTTAMLAAGTSSYILTSNGAAAPSWQPASATGVTSVAATVPAFLNVSGSPITGAGTLAFTLSGTALPVANGGTGLTAVGTTGNVLTSNGTSWVSSAPAASGISTGKSIAMAMIFGF